MSNSWLGECYFSRVFNDKAESYKATAAVFCDSRKLYQDIVKRYLQQQGLQVDRFEKIRLIERGNAKEEELNLIQTIDKRRIIAMGTLQEVVKENQAEERYLKICELEDVKPLDLQVGVWPKKAVPTELKDWLFGDLGVTHSEAEQYSDTESLPEMKTYALVDAAKVDNFPLLLEGSELNHECLFKGKASEELKEVAAYLIELKLDDPLTTSLFTESGLPGHLWENDCAVFLRSRAKLSELRHHFRKFLRLYSEASHSWKYFRFYAPETLRTLVTAFERSQFEAFAKNIRLFACRSPESGFIFITRREETHIKKASVAEVV
ncbi:DUF4123 domain-containing protein [Kangiella shandongensis]|uniref:DUF4123 domain-containing protein n=1 Tax=Kangiella shandongensis TaxID=2763258 RepID=UPI001CBAA580|nr:DUF4123 domain-containing protein [Kangiella shandongensis]